MASANARAYYELWQLENYGNILSTDENMYADEDHDEWKENSSAVKQCDPFIDCTKI